LRDATGGWNACTEEEPVLPEDQVWDTVDQYASDLSNIGAVGIEGAAGSDENIAASLERFSHAYETGRALNLTDAMRHFRSASSCDNAFKKAIAQVAQKLSAHDCSGAQDRIKLADRRDDQARQGEREGRIELQELAG
jgi:hypothetical protein